MPSRHTAVDTWYRDHGPALLLFALAMTHGDRHRAQDAVHQVFLRVLERPVAAEDIRAYLFTAVRNTILNGIRQDQRETPDAWFTTVSHDPTEELALRRALLDLPPDQREIVVLHVWGGFTFAQAAGVLGIPANTAASRYRYALAKLRDLLSRQEIPHAL